MTGVSFSSARTHPTRWSLEWPPPIRRLTRWKLRRLRPTCQTAKLEVSQRGSFFSWLSLDFASSSTSTTASSSDIGWPGADGATTRLRGLLQPFDTWPKVSESGVPSERNGPNLGGSRRIGFALFSENCTGEPDALERKTWTPLWAGLSTTQPQVSQTTTLIWRDKWLTMLSHQDPTERQL